MHNPCLTTKKHTHCAHTDSGHRTRSRHLSLVFARNYSLGSLFLTGLELLWFFEVCPGSGALTVVRTAPHSPQYGPRRRSRAASCRGRCGAAVVSRHLRRANRQTRKRRHGKRTSALVVFSRGNHASGMSLMSILVDVGGQICNRHLHTPKQEQQQSGKEHWIALRQLLCSSCLIVASDTATINKKKKKMVVRRDDWVWGQNKI